MWDCPSPVSLYSGMMGCLLSQILSRHFSVASVEVRCQTGRNSSTTKASPAAQSLLHSPRAHCSAQSCCRGQIDPMCLLWGKGGRQYQAPREPGCRIGGGGWTWKAEVINK